MAYNAQQPRQHARQRRHSLYDAPPHHAPPPAYKPDPYADQYGGYTPAALPWNPYHHHQAAQPPAAPQPTGYGYFSWPSTSTVDSLSSSLELQKVPMQGGGKPKKGLFASLRRKSHGPEGHLHRFLLHARPTSIIYDVRNPAVAACLATAPPAPLSPADRAQFATSPPRAHMRITCSSMPWSIDVSNSGGVTVGDVLDALANALQRRVRRSEWLIAQEGLQEKIVRAFAWRCYSARGPPGQEEAQGPKRVDWLLKKTVFRGISHGSEEDTWLLHLGSH